MCWMKRLRKHFSPLVSVAGCLGYDVLAVQRLIMIENGCFSCWLFRL